MLDEMLNLVREAEEEARKIAARGNKEAERILRKVEELKKTKVATLNMMEDLNEKMENLVCGV